MNTASYSVVRDSISAVSGTIEQFGLSATGVYEDRAIHTKATTGSYTLGGEEIDRPAREYISHFGGHREVENAVGFVDPTDRQEVIETAVAALSGCINAAVSMSAIAKGIKLTTLVTSVHIDWDPFVFLHLRDIEDSDSEPVDMFDDLEVEIEVAGENLDEADRAYLEESVGRLQSRDAGPRLRAERSCEW